MANESPLYRVAQKHGINSETLHRARRDGLPSWMTQKGKRFFVDEDHPDFKIWIKAKTKKSIQQKMSIQKKKALPKNFEETRRRAKRKNLIPSDPEDKKDLPPAPGDVEGMLSEEETLRLQMLSIQADLSEPIVKLELAKYKIENERLNLKIKAGELIEFAVAEHLFLGYLDRINVEKLMFVKKIMEKIDRLVFQEVIQGIPIDGISEEDRKIVEPLLQKLEVRPLSKKIADLIVREEEEIVRMVKESQAKELKEWIEERN